MSDRGKRPIRIGNCSGATTDPGYQMLRQATRGPIDVITGDYLAELNLAWNIAAYNAGKHPGYEATAKDGLLQTLPVLNEKRIKVIINGGALNPQGLAEEVYAKVKEEGYSLTVAWVSGDNVLSQLPELVKNLRHLDANNSSVVVPDSARAFLHDPDKPVVSAHAYLGARGIRQALDEGADIVICGRVADASPVIGAAQWWFGWGEEEFDKLAHALVAGHLTECSAYATGANFAGFDKYPLEYFVDVGFPIVEIEESGEHVVTKHAGTAGIVNADVVKCQFLYELQGELYLNSDVTADLSDVVIEDVGKDRVRVTGIKGLPPPPTTKLAITFADGYQCELLINATAYALDRKYTLAETQLRAKLTDLGVLQDFTVLEFQRIGLPEPNPRSQRRGTTYLRIFAQAAKAETVAKVGSAFLEVFMQHFSGMHCSMDLRTLAPKQFLTYYPAVIPQSVLQETAHILSPVPRSLAAGHPPTTAPLLERRNYDTPTPSLLASFGPTEWRPLGDIVLARSGDKGANINIGFFIPGDSGREWEWLRTFLTRGKMQELMGEDWREGLVLERVEFPRIRAVHFVVYGALGRGVSSCPSLDGLGKGFADYVRARHVEVPIAFMTGGRVGL